MVNITISKRSAFLIVLAILLIIPTIAMAGTVFDDVDDTDTHIDGITFMKDSGVSIGCAPGKYCPGDPVSRAQMATFMYRLSGTDPATDPSVNADKVDGFDASDLMTSAYSTFNDGPVTLGANQDPFLTLSGLPAGHYVIMAKTWIENDSTNAVFMQCRLATPTDFDEVRVLLEPNGSNADSQSLAFNVVHTFASDNGEVDLWCNAFGPLREANDAKITAIRVGELTNTFGG